MQKSSNGPVALALLIITVGVGWLLTALAVAPEINWVLSLSLGMIGVLAFVVSGGIDKVSAFMSGSLGGAQPVSGATFAIEILADAQKGGRVNQAARAGCALQQQRRSNLADQLRFLGELLKP